jgi:NADH-quinone oxidoreductase subunit C
MSQNQSQNLDQLSAALVIALGDRIIECKQAHGEVSLTVAPESYIESCLILRDDKNLKFEQLIDLCGLDRSEYGNELNESQRFWVVCHLLSISKNLRVRLKVCCVDNDLPSMASLVDVWSSANWYEREAFDLYGIVFEGHPDLRRILTDYGFIGHPFRKDFPLSGHVEMRYDPELGRVVYQPVSIEPREITPRIIREPQYGGLK